MAYLAWLGPIPLAESRKSLLKVFLRAFLDENRRYWLASIPPGAVMYRDELSAPGRARLKNHDVVGRGPQPSDKPGDVLRPGLVPPDPDATQELDPELEVGGVGPHGGGRAVERLEVRQVGLDGCHRLAGGIDHRPGLGSAGHQDPLDAHPGHL